MGKCSTAGSMPLHLSQVPMADFHSVDVVYTGNHGFLFLQYDHRHDWGQPGQKLSIGRWHTLVQSWCLDKGSSVVVYEVKQFSWFDFLIPIL